MNVKFIFSGIDQQELIIYIQDGDFFISHLAANFSAKYPNIHISHASVDEVLNSSGTPFDFTFMQPICDLSEYNYELLLEDELIAIVSKDNPLSQYDEIELSMLKSENFVGLYDTIPIRIVTDKFCREVGHFVPNYTFKSHEDFATIYRVSKNAGVAILPYKYYSIHPSNDVKVLRIKNTMCSKLIIAWAKDRTLSVPEQAFLDYCKQWFKAL